MIRPLLLALTFALLIAAPAGAAGPDRPRPGPEPGGRRRRRRHRAHRLRHRRRATSTAACRAAPWPATCARCSPLPGADGGLAILDRPDGTLALIRSTVAVRRRAGHARPHVPARLGRPRRHLDAAGGDRQRQLPLRTPSSSPRDGQSLLTLQLDTRAANFAQAPVHRRPDARPQPQRRSEREHVLGRHDRARRRPRPDGQRRLLRRRWRLFGGGDVYDLNAWATRGTVRRVSDGELVDRPARDVPVRARAAGQPAPAAVPGAVRVPLLRHPPRALPPRPAPPAPTAASSGPRRALQDARGRLHVVADTASAGALDVRRSTPAPGTRRSSWFGRTTVLFRTADDARKPAERPSRRGRRRARLRALARHDQRVGDAAAQAKRQVPPARQPERPARPAQR